MLHVPPIPVFLVISYVDQIATGQWVRVENIIEVIPTRLDNLSDPEVKTKIDRYRESYPNLTVMYFARHDESLLQKAVKDA